MRRLLPILLLCTCLKAAAQEQSAFFTRTNDDYVDDRIFFGALAAGMNFCQVDGDALSGYHRVGINAGAIVYVRPHGGKFGGSLEMRYTQKGCANAYEAASATGAGVDRYGIKLGYMEIPVMLHFWPAGKLSYSAGLAFSYLISSSEYAELGYPVNIDPDLFPFQKSEVSWLAGANYSFWNHWSVEGRFQYSLSTIRKAQYIPPDFNTGTGHEFNNMFSLRLQYLF